MNITVCAEGFTTPAAMTDDTLMDKNTGTHFIKDEMGGWRFDGDIHARLEAEVRDAAGRTEAVSVRVVAGPEQEEVARAVAPMLAGELFIGTFGRVLHIEYVAVGDEPGWYADVEAL